MELSEIEERPEVEELTAHEELTHSYESIQTLVNNIDITNSEYINDLLDELNDPMKENLIAKISNGENGSNDTELIGMLSKMQKEEEVLQIENQYFDVDVFPRDLMQVVSLVEVAKVRGSKRMVMLFHSFQALQATQKTIITKTIAKYVHDYNYHKFDAKIIELEAMVQHFNAKKAETNMSVEDLRHKYETDIEELIRNLVTTKNLIRVSVCVT